MSMTEDQHRRLLEIIKVLAMLAYPGDEPIGGPNHERLILTLGQIAGLATMALDPKKKLP